MGKTKTDSNQIRELDDPEIKLHKRSKIVDITLSFILYFSWRLFIDSQKLTELGECNLGIDIYNALKAVLEVIIWLYIFSLMFYSQKFVLQRELVIVISILLIIIYFLIQNY